MDNGRCSTRGFGSELRFEVGRALPPGASPELVRQVADLAVTPGSGTGVLLVTAPEVTDVSALGTRKDGTSIYRPPNEARYTTTGHLDLEERIFRQARKQVPQRVSEGMARRALAGSGLTEEQEDAAVRLLTSATMVSVLTAAAGAGKTHMVAAYAQAWMRLTSRVIGITIAQNAARQMTAEGLAEVYNAAAFLGKTKGSDLLRYPVTISAGDVLVLDESSMISTADLALIMDYADRAGALVIPTGDAAQLGPVEAGGMFGALIAELGAAELSEVMRFDQQWERDASARLREGDFSAVAAYDRRGQSALPAFPVHTGAIPCRRNCSALVVGVKGTQEISEKRNFLLSGPWHLLLAQRTAAVRKWPGSERPSDQHARISELGMIMTEMLNQDSRPQDDQA